MCYVQEVHGHLRKLSGTDQKQQDTGFPSEFQDFTTRSQNNTLLNLGIVNELGPHIPSIK